MPLPPLSAEEIAKLRARHTDAGYSHEIECDCDSVLRLLDEVERCRTVMRRIDASAVLCPACWKSCIQGERHGHFPDCELDALLRPEA